MTEPRLPEYDSPPVDEVALGITFAPIEDFKIPHFGVYWNTIRDRYPKCEVQPPSPPQIEPLPFGAGMSFQLVSDPNAVRCWFLDEDGNNLIQLQPDRFIRNWRQVGEGGQAYPRYASLRPSFEGEWKSFAQFLSANGLTVPRAIQCEVTYINNIERGGVWESFSDLPKIATFWNGMPQNSFLAAPESASIGLAYAMENKSDRLRVTLQHAVRIRDGKDILQLSLTARMKPMSDGLEGILASFDNGRNWIVRAFTDFTTPEMHKVWKRRA